MRDRMYSLIIYFFICSTLYAGTCLADTALIVPSPKGLIWKNFNVEIKGNWKIVTSGSGEILDIAEYLEGELSDKAGVYVGIQRSSLTDFKKSIILGLSSEGSVKDALKAENSLVPVKLNKEGYFLEIFEDRIVITAGDPAGLFYGVQTLLQMVKPSMDGKVVLPAAKITDFPTMSLRGVHILDPDIDKLKGYLKYMAGLKMNFVMISSWKLFDLGEGDNAQKFQDIFNYARKLFIEPVPELGTFGAGGPVLTKEPYAAEGIWVKDELFRFRGDKAEPVLGSKSNLVNLIRTDESNVIITDTSKSKIYKEGTDYQIVNGKTVYPYLPSNTPAEIIRIPSGSIGDMQQVLISYDYVENKCVKWAPWSIPYCPSSELTYRVMFKSLEGAISVLQPRYIGIGHDEIRGMNRDSRCKKRNMTNAELLADDINKLDGFVKSLDPKVRLMMWDDMVNPWHNGGDENYQVQFGGVPGKTYEAIDFIPKDIIMMIWWGDADDRLAKMKNSPAYFGSKGFDYLAAAYKDKKNISDWLDLIKNRSSCIGLITTTWDGWDNNIDGIKYTAEMGWH